MNIFLSCAVLILFTSQLFAASITFEIHYQEADSGKVVSQEKSLEIPGSSAISHEGVYKTLFVLKLANLIQTSLTDYHQALSFLPYEVRPQEVNVGLRPIPCPRPLPDLKEHAARLLYNLDQLETRASFATDSDVAEAIALVKKLAENMASGQVGPSFEAARPVKRMMAQNMAGASAMSLNVTSGGVKDYSHFKKQLQDGYVPQVEAFYEEGFLSSFSLGLEGASSDELLTVTPEYAYDKEAHKLYVQVGMASNVTPETFKRPPVNLAFVIDISGSMAATDFTERSRLDWAKDAIGQVLLNLNEQDTLSIVIFDSISEVLLAPTPAIDKAAIIKKVQALQPRNSTNLYAGLADGFKLASLAIRPHYQNRVILFSDAGLNTGVTDSSNLLRLVSDYAAEEIGLTAIGIGENFHHDFIHKITMSKGGNAYFVHTGKDMLKFFNNFDYLVTPVAYNFKLQAKLQDCNAKLVQAHGVPMSKEEKKQPVQELINVRTLFFSEEGGAIVLEYDVS